MKFTQRLQWKFSLAWMSIQKIFTSIAEQTARHVEIARLSFQIRNGEQQMDHVFEQVGRFFYESYGKGLDMNAITAHAICQTSLAEYKRLQTELKTVEQRRDALKEEAGVTPWTAFAEWAQKNGMTLDSLIIPVHLKPPSLTLQELALPHGVLVIAIQRKERFIQPHGSVLLKRGDRLTLLGPFSLIAQVIQKFSSPS